MNQVNNQDQYDKDQYDIRTISTKISDPSLSRKKLMGVAAIVASAFIALSIGAGIYFGLNPLGPMVHLTSNYSLNIPVIALGGTGIAGAIYLRVFLSKKGRAEDSFAALIPNVIAEKVRKEIASGSNTYDVFDGSKDLQIRFGQIAHKKVDITDNLKGYWFPVSASGPSDSTVILFAGYTEEENANYHHMHHLVEYYMNKGIDVLLVDNRGYGLSAEAKIFGEDQEVNAYKDAVDALNFVRDKGIPDDKIIVHGFSQGGAIAAGLAVLAPNISALVLDHVYTTVEQAMKDDARFLPLSLHRIAKKAAFPRYQLETSGATLETDGYDTLGKIEKIRAEIFLIEGEKDRNVSTAKALLMRRYERELKQGHYMLAKGEHLYNINPTLQDISLKGGHDLQEDHSSLGTFIYKAMTKTKPLSA